MTEHLSEPPALLYRPAKIIVRVLVGSLAVGAVLDLMLMALQSAIGLWYPYLFDDVTPLQGNDEIALVLAFTGVAILSVLAYLLSVVMFCVWVFRANKNARALGAQGMQFTAGWCVGWFFIPIMSLWKPYQAVREIYISSDPDGDEDDRYNREPAPLLAWWWAAWIIGNIISRVDSKISTNSDPAIQAASAWSGTISSGFGVLSSVLAIAVVVTIHRRQERKATLSPHLMQAVCMGCNYDLRASEGAWCPECGKPIPGRDLAAW